MTPLASQIQREDLTTKLQNYDSTQPLGWDKSRPNEVTLSLKNGEQLTVAFPIGTNLNETFLAGRLPTKLDEISGLTALNTVEGLGVQTRSLANAINNYFERYNASEVLPIKDNEVSSIARSNVPSLVDELLQNTESRFGVRSFVAESIAQLDFSEAPSIRPENDSIILYLVDNESGKPAYSTIDILLPRGHTVDLHELAETIYENKNLPAAAAKSTEQIVERLEKYLASHGITFKDLDFDIRMDKVIQPTPKAVEPVKKPGFFARKFQSAVDLGRTAISKLSNVFTAKSENVGGPIDQESVAKLQPARLALANSTSEIPAPVLDVKPTVETSSLATSLKKLVAVPVVEIKILVDRLAASNLKGTTEYAVNLVSEALGIDPTELNRKHGKINVSPEVAELSEYRKDNHISNGNKLRAKFDQVVGQLVDWKSLEAVRLENRSALPVAQSSKVTSLSKSSVIEVGGEIVSSSPTGGLLAKTLQLISKVPSVPEILYAVSGRISAELEVIQKSFARKPSWVAAGIALMAFASAATSLGSKGSQSASDDLPAPALSQSGLGLNTSNPTAPTVQMTPNNSVSNSLSDLISINTELAIPATRSLGLDVAEKFAEVAEAFNSRPVVDSKPVVAPAPLIEEANLVAQKFQQIADEINAKPPVAIPVVAPIVEKVAMPLKDVIKLAYYAGVGNNNKANGKKEFEKASNFLVGQFGNDFDLSKLISEVKKDPSATKQLDPEWKTFLAGVRSAAPKKSGENLAQAKLIQEQIAARLAVEPTSPEKFEPKIAKSPEATPALEEKTLKTSEPKAQAQTNQNEQATSKSLDSLPDATVELEQVTPKDLGLLLRRIAGCNHKNADQEPSYLVASRIGISTEELDWLNNSKDVLVEVSSGISSLIKEMNNGTINTKELRRLFDNLDSQKDEKQVNWAEVDRIAKQKLADSSRASKHLSSNSRGHATEQVETKFQYQMNRSAGLLRPTARTIVMSENGAPVAAYTESGILKRQGTYLFQGGVTNPRYKTILNEKFKKYSGKTPVDEEL